MSNLEPAKRAVRDSYIAIVRKGLDTFYEVGLALMRLNEGRLYVETHDTFEDFCRETFDMSRSYAYRLIAAAKVVDNVKTVSPTGDIPASESQARPLAELPEEEQAEAWQEAVETAPKSGVTAEHVAEVVEKRKPSKPAAPKPTVAPIWREIEKHINAASNLFGAHAQDCDEAADVKQALEYAAEQFAYYVRMESE